MKWAVPIDFSNPGLNLKMHTASCGRRGSDVNSCGAGPPGSLLHFSSVQAAFLGLVPRMRVNIGRCFTRRRRLWFFHVYPNLLASHEDPSASQSRQGGMNTKAKKNRTLAAFVCASPMVCPARPLPIRTWNTLSDSRSTSATRSILPVTTSSSNFLVRSRCQKRVTISLLSPSMSIGMVVSSRLLGGPTRSSFVGMTGTGGKEIGRGLESSGEGRQQDY